MAIDTREELAAATATRLWWTRRFLPLPTASIGLVDKQTLLGQYVEITPAEPGFEVRYPLSATLRTNGITTAELRTTGVTTGVLRTNGRTRAEVAGG